MWFITQGNMVSREFREKIYKYKWIHRCLLYIYHNKGRLTCKKIAMQNDYHVRLRRLKENRLKDRCFIIGNGPSLTIEDLEKVKDEDCLATNGIVNVFNNTSWRPKYYFLMDRYATYDPECIRDLDVEHVFLGSYYYLNNRVLRKDAFCIRERMFFSRRNYKFSDDIEKYIVNGCTVSYFAMQAAVYLGYKEIYLIGFDNTYKYEKHADGNVVDTGVIKAHFYQDNNPRNIVGEPVEMEKAYKSFKEYAGLHGIRVKNLTRGGNLEVFDRDELENIIGD